MLKKILFFIICVNLYSLKINYFYDTKINSRLENIYPYSLYRDKIDILNEKKVKMKMEYSVNYSIIESLGSLTDNDLILNIFIVYCPEMKFAKGGYIEIANKNILNNNLNTEENKMDGKNKEEYKLNKKSTQSKNDIDDLQKKIEKKRLYFILLHNDYSEKELLHESLHTIAELGDEYFDEEINLKWNKGEVKYKNLSIYPKDGTKNREWINIKSIVNTINPKLYDRPENVYEGGNGYKYGIYRPYNSCIMKDLNDNICPVCLYYLIENLNKLTDKNIRFEELIKKHNK